MEVNSEGGSKEKGIAFARGCMGTRDTSMKTRPAPGSPPASAHPPSHLLTASAPPFTPTAAAVSPAPAAQSQGRGTLEQGGSRGGRCSAPCSRPRARRRPGPSLGPCGGPGWGSYSGGLTDSPAPAWTPLTLSRSPHPSQDLPTPARIQQLCSACGPSVLRTAARPPFQVPTGTRSWQGGSKWSESWHLVTA